MSDQFSFSIDSTDKFTDRHIGPNVDEVQQMLHVVGQGSLDDLINDAVPANIRMKQALGIP